MLPPKDRLTICFAHAPTRCRSASPRARRGSRLSGAEREALERASARRTCWWFPCSGATSLSAAAPSCVHPVDQRRDDQYSSEVLQHAGMRLASARGVNARAVAEHAISLILALAAAAARGARQPGKAGLARHDRRAHAARGRARRQDAADHRPGAHRRASWHGSPRRSTWGDRHAARPRGEEGADSCTAWQS